MTEPFICPPEHPHAATSTCYRHGCKCVPCRARAARIRGAMRKARREGRVAVQPASSVRDHINMLIASGITQSAIARLAGVDVGTVARIRGDKSKTSYASVAAALLSITPARTPPPSKAKGWVSPVGTIRRLQALAAIGYPLVTVSEWAGMERGWATRHMKGDLWLVTERSRDAVAAVYERLSMTPAVGGYSDRVRARARRNGWAPPLAWDDGAIDDPEAQPDFGVRTLEDRLLDAAEHRAEVQRLTILQMSTAQIADRLDVSTRTVTRLRGAA